MFGRYGLENKKRPIQRSNVFKREKYFAESFAYSTLQKRICRIQEFRLACFRRQYYYTINHDKIVLKTRRNVNVYYRRSTLCGL